MTNKKMKLTHLAKRYARAFVRSSVRKKEAGAWYAQLGNFSKLISETPPLSQSLLHPGIPFVKKKELLERFIAQPILLRFFLHLIRRNQLRLVPEIVRQAQRLFDEAEGITRARVRTASVLSSDQKERLAESLKVFFQRPVFVEETVAPELLAGMVIRVGDTIMDHSLKGQLELLEKELVERVMNGNSS